MNKFFGSIVTWNHKLLLIVGVMVVTTMMTVMPSQTTAQTNRTIRAVSVGTQPGQQVTVAFQLDSLGNEASASFTVTFNQAILSNPAVVLGTGVPSGTTVGTNTAQVANGRIGILIATPNAYAAGTRQIIRITFDVAASAPLGLTPIGFTNSPVSQSVSAAQGGALFTDVVYQPGNVQIGSTAAGVAISGRVLTPDGRGLRNARVSITNSDGVVRSATTSSFGVYSFGDVAAGDSYVIGVSSKQYRFTSRVLQVIDSLSDFDFVGQE